MFLPRKETNSFKLLQILHENGDLNMDQLLHYLSLVGSARKDRAIDSLNTLLKKKLVGLRNDKYYLRDETIAVLDDVLEMQNKFVMKDLVSSPYHNAFTPEMRGYDAKLFANKRGY